MKPLSKFEKVVVVATVTAGVGVAATAALATSMEIDGESCMRVV